MFNFMVDVKSFYKDFDKADFSKVDKSKIIEIKNCVKRVNKRRINCRYELYRGIRKYINIMNHIRMNPRLYNLSSNEEVYLLFMFCVDPDFEAFMIFNEYNKIEEIKSKLELKFGISDINLAKIEREFIKYFMIDEDKKKINEELDKRIWK